MAGVIGVVNGTNGVPLGPAVIGTAGGLSFTGMPMCLPGEPNNNCQRQHAHNNSDVNAYTLESAEQPLLIGQSGEAYARLAIEADGSMLFGDGTGPFDTTLRRHIARKVQWDPPPIQPGKTAVKVVVRPQSTTLHPFLWLLWIYQAI